MKNQELIRKLLSDQLTEQEEKLLKASDEYLALEKIWVGLSSAKPPEYSVKEELKRFHEKQQPDTKLRTIGLDNYWLKVAASILLISVFGYFLLNYVQRNEQMVLSEDFKVFYLPDSSSVVLNKGSEIAYETNNWASLRKVYLKGEAFFKVKPGSSFEVVTKDERVTVLGTSFNVKKRNKFYEVVCIEGKVGVEAPKKKLTLIAGEGYRESMIGEERFKSTLKNKPNWFDGNSFFQRTPFYVVLEELENQYDIIIEPKGIDLNETFTGGFPNDNLTLALKSVMTSSGYLFQVKDGQVLVTSGER